MGLLEWGTAPRAEDPAKRAERYGGGIPGAYAPNMDGDWKDRWKARLAGTRTGVRVRVEVRKTCTAPGTSAQVLVIVHEDGTVRMSMNSTAEFSPLEFARLSIAVTEARQAIITWRAQHPLGEPA